MHDLLAIGTELKLSDSRQALAPSHGLGAAQHPVEVAGIRDSLVASAPAGVAVCSALDLMVAQAGVAIVATPDACLDPAVLTVTTERCPLVVTGAADTAAVEGRSASTVWAVHLIRAEIDASLSDAEVDGSSPACVGSRCIDPVAGCDGGRDEGWSQCIGGAKRAAEDERHEAVARAVRAPWS